MSPAEQKRAVTEVKTRRAGSVYWRNLREAFEQINGMPDVEYIATTVPAPSCDMVTKILPIARNWLDDFQTEWTKKQVGDGSQAEVEIELETITRAWNRTSDSVRKAFVAELKDGGWL